MPVTDDADLRALLDAETVTVIGCSTSPEKAAHRIPRYLQEHGYRVIPVNPFADEVLGETAYDDLGAVSDPVGLVDVFRPDEEVPGVADDVLARHADRGDVEGLWLQLGISHDEAAGRVEAEGIPVVQDRCAKVERERLFG